jgi:cytochrome c peroxidase
MLSDAPLPQRRPMPSFRHLAIAATTFAGFTAAQLPLATAPAQNPSTPPKVVLGKILFWEEQLSSDDSVACGTCHLPEFGGGDGRLGGLHPGFDGVFGTADDVAGSGGIVRQAINGDFKPHGAFGLRRQATGRSSPTNLGAAHFTELFWDGRADGQFDDPETGLTLIPFGGALEQQAIGPILNAVEMGHEGRTWNDVRQKLAAAVPLRLASNLPVDVQAALQQNPTYPNLFTAAFGDPAITGARIGFALASYQRTLNPDDTPWDRYVAGNSQAMTASEKAGWLVFQNQGRCIACHWAPLFSDDLPHNLGLRYGAEDTGYFGVTNQPVDFAAFKTPTLRNAGLRQRLFHNGQSPGLGDPAQWTDPASTLNVYLAGHGVDVSNLDPFMLPLQNLGVTPAEVMLAQDFVRTALTDARAAAALPPFDHPTLRSTAVPPPRAFGPAAPAGREAALVDTVPTFPGNAAFKLGIGAGSGSTFALLAWGLQSIEPNQTVLGLPVHLHALGFVGVPLTNLPGQPAHATWRIALPNDPTLATVPFYFEALALDPLAPNGLAASSGHEFFIR